MLTIAFVACFAVGFLFAVLMFVLGEVLDFAHVEVDGPGPLSGSVLATFISGFGAGGFIAHKGAGWSSFGSIAAALLCGLALASIALFTLKFLYKRGNVGGEYSLEEATGTEGQITIPIPAEGKGEVAFTFKKARQIAPALSVDGKALGKFTIVKIVKVVSDTLIVERKKEAS